MATFTVIHDDDGKINAARHLVEDVEQTSSPDLSRDTITINYKVVSMGDSVSIFPIDDEVDDLTTLFWLISGREISMDVGGRLATALHTAGYTLTQTGDQNDVDLTSNESEETTPDYSTSKDPLGEWFRHIGTKLSNRDYEDGIKILDRFKSELLETTAEIASGEELEEGSFSSGPVYHQCTINNYYGPFEEGEN